MSASPVLLRACGRGNQSACDIARKLRVMYAGSVLSFSDVDLKKEHDNKLPFTGTLLLVDQASDKPPHGSEGHRIFVPRQAAMRALPGIIGQAVNYQPEGLEAHASRHKVGVITKAWMEGPRVKVAGQIWIHDFPEAKVLRNRRDLGMSMELSSVYVEDDESDVWVLEKFDFTGATILKKNAAAYTKTDLAAVAAAAKASKGINVMAKHQEEKKRKVAAAHRDTGQSGDLALMAQAIQGSVANAITTAFAPVVAEIKASGQRTNEALEELKGLHLTQIHAAADADEDEDEEIVLTAAGEEDASASESAEMEASASASASEEMEAARAEEDASEDESSASDESSMEAALEDMGLEDASEEPGHLNKNASNKGSKTTVTDPPNQGEHFKGNVAKGRLKGGAARKVKAQGREQMRKTPTATVLQAAALVGDLQASVRHLKKAHKIQAAQHAEEVGKLRGKLKRLNAQVDRFAAQESRRSAMSHELVAIGEKVGVDFYETRRNGQKYSVRAFDQILAAAEETGVQLNPRQRVAIKMIAEQNGLLDEGAVDRTIGRS